MKKKITFALGCIVLAGCLWYLFIKPYDYLVTFKIKALPGTINQTIKTWGISSNRTTTLYQEDLCHIAQIIHFGDSIHHYNFEIIPINDSLSKVNVFIKDDQNSLMNKLTVPFSNTPFKKNCVATVKDLSEKLNEHVHNFKVTVIGRENIKPRFCAYVSLKKSQYEKASGMMQNYSLLSNFIANHGLRPNGNPLVEITQWNRATDSISYNFCFPILKPDSLPSNPVIAYKEIPASKAIKAVYNGNYITSDRAWYALRHYAQKEGLEITEKPIEIFHNNPSFGGNAIHWKAEIYMPLKTKS